MRQMVVSRIESRGIEPYSSWQLYPYFFTIGSMSSPISASAGNEKDTTYIIGEEKTIFILTRKVKLSKKSFL